MVESAGAASGSRSTLIGVIAAIVAVGVLGCLAYYAIQRAMELQHRTACANNLSQIGYVCQAYWAGHQQACPKVWTATVDQATQATRWDAIGNTRTGATPPAAVDKGPEIPIESNTANLWVLVKTGLIENPAVFVCPAAKGHAFETDVTDCTKVRDFAGPQNISYSYQNVFGPYRLTSAASPDLAIAADANPCRADFCGPRGATTRYMATHPQYEVEGWGEIKDRHFANSPNHNFKGQNVLYLDGHVQWCDNPFCGVEYDNIWTKSNWLGPWKEPGVPPSGGGEPDPNHVATLEGNSDNSSYPDPGTPGTVSLEPSNRDDSFLVP